MLYINIMQNNLNKSDNAYVLYNFTNKTHTILNR